MIDSKGRKFIDKPVDFFAKLAFKANLTPDNVTILAFIFGLIASIFIAYDRIALSLLMLWFSGLLDVVDGQLARISNKTSKSGALLDMILDRMVEGFFVLGMVISNQNLAVPVILFLIVVIFNFSTFLAAGALITNKSVKSMHYDTGLIERTETFIFFTIAAIAVNQRAILLILMTLLIALTGIKRFVKIYNHLKNEETSKDI